MRKSIIYKGQQYILDAKETRKEFFEELTETKDGLFLFILITQYTVRQPKVFLKNIFLPF